MHRKEHRALAQEQNLCGYGRYHGQEGFTDALERLQAGINS